MEDVRETLGMISEALAQLLIWAKNLEKEGIVPQGALRKSSLLLEMSHLEKEVAWIEKYLGTAEDQEFSKALSNRKDEAFEKIKQIQNEIKSM